MTHISSIGAGMFSDLSVAVDLDETLGKVPIAITAPGEVTLKDCFTEEVLNGTAATAGSGQFIRITGVREFPAMGTPPNVVNVPVYGQATSQQIQGQADAPSMEIQLNYIGTDWDDTVDYLGDMVGDGIQRVFRFTLLNSPPEAAFPDTYASDPTGLGLNSHQNTQYMWIGKLEALQVTPQLTDANTATITLTIQSDFYGAYTD